MFAIRLDQILEVEDFDRLKSLQRDGDGGVELDGHSCGCAATYDLWHQRFIRGESSSFMIRAVSRAWM